MTTDMHAVAEEWAERYARAWRAGDMDAMAQLYSEDCVHYVPFQGIKRGRKAIRQMLARYEDSEYPEVRLEIVLVEGDRAYAEYWVTCVHPERGKATIAGCNVVRFDADGRTDRVRDLIAITPGHFPLDGPWTQS
ncbi:nuclear transport factor 2 family protein [Nocardia sp. NPDC052566]|uniref:nuclear transport factor 2 family protein n=1 Tax=Nocardia sp. NPDC052566 TaxID=3364330 RepID=UPI0037CC6B67